jgi:hypothetical protein
MRTRLVIAAATIVAALGISSGPASATPESDKPFAAGVVRMTGAAEAPGPGDADGRGIFGYVAAGNKLCYILTAQRIEPAVVAHIHVAPPGAPGPILIGLEAPTDGLSFDCITTVPNDTPNSNAVLLQSELDAIIANPAGHYVNVHNAPFPAGAIRAQLR